MSTDTGPAEIASLIGDEPRYRTFVVLKLQEHGQRLTSIENKMPAITSSVSDTADTRAQFAGARNAILGFGAVLTILAAIGGFVVWIVSIAGKGAP